MKRYTSNFVVKFHHVVFFKGIKRIYKPMN